MLLEIVVMVSLVIVWFFLAIPVHELGHLICLRLMGHRGPLKVTWLDLMVFFRRGDGVAGRVFLPDEINVFAPLVRRRHLSFFLIGISGGAFASLVCGSLAFAVGTLCDSWLIFPVIGALAFTSACQIIYAIIESGDAVEFAEWPDCLPLLKPVP